MATEQTVQPVEVRNFDMTFGRMVWFMVKWAIAAIPAFLILLVLGVFAVTAFTRLPVALDAYQASRPVRESSETTAIVDAQIADVQRLLQAGKYMDAYSRAHGALNASGVSQAHRDELQSLATQAWRGMSQPAQ